MASSSGNSSGSTQFQNSGSEEDLQVLMDQRKRKRMQSNRESARRSRMRKQKHLDDLNAQVAQLKKQNSEILTSTDITTRHYLNVEAENSVLRAQMVELSQRLQSLNDILGYMDTGNGGVFEPQLDHHLMNINPWNLMYLNQPIMADMIQY
ncbi:bZIP transcription factor 44-like [Cornus florida]|uniref:bZIP transcription factor 44-like n=1 Tax=Cornus florida TaxID=4283 RepID=UPI00289B96EB|nr:bZIP transcription factor 44-like [Cornus florida]